ncbi:MAG: serine/threonine-protein kinase [Cyanobacteria bacterium P01_F01_bin.150]
MNNRSPDTPHEPDIETFVNLPSNKLLSPDPKLLEPCCETREDAQSMNQQVAMNSSLLPQDVTVEPTVPYPFESAAQRHTEPTVKIPDSASNTETKSLEETGTAGRSPFRSTYLSNLNLSGLRLTNLSRLLLDHSQLLRDDGKGLSLLGVGHGIVAGIAVVASGLTILNPPWIQSLEYEVQAFFFQHRGTISPPQDIVILEIDETSLAQGEFYSSDPDKYSDLELIQQWPWQRQVYAIAIERVMEAGAKAVALDLILDRPSVWGDKDDGFLQYALERYPERIVLASSFDDSANDTGSTLQLAPPLVRFLDAGGRPGVINYPFAPNDRIHKFSQVWLQDQADSDIAMQTYLNGLPDSLTQTFVEQTVLAAQNRNMVETVEADLSLRGEQIFFYGPAGTFEHEAFWTILDPQNWEVHQFQNTFRDKIVLIGPTAKLFQDSHRTPFGFMSGIEIHANAIATYLNNRSITEALPNPYLKAGLVLGLTILTGLGASYPRRTSYRMLITLAGVSAWTVFSYVSWVAGRLALPTAVPLGAITLGGAGYVTTGLLQEKLRKLKLRSALKQYVSSPIVQDIINQQDDLHDLISEEEKETIGKILDGRYKIIEILASGGFGQTFIAQDLRRPGQPRCVVKQLRPVSNDPRVFHLSRRLFNKEAETLERLNHNQIPQLLAYFEEAQGFYLVQELVEGHPLRYELLPKPSSELNVILILKELLEILVFIHDMRVIHRDIKPSNIIRRHSDQRLVLIDFGAVKEIQATAPGEEGEPDKTVSIGTRGYISNEQLAGNPRFNSDIYAVGVIGIQASTGLSPDKLVDDAETGELVWQPFSDHSEALKEIIDKMVRYDFSKRYQSAQDVLEDLQPLLDMHITDDEGAVSASLPAYTILKSHHRTEFGDETIELTDGDLDATVPWPTGVKEDLIDDATNS